MLDTLKAIAHPGSITAILALFAFGVALLHARPRWGRRWLTVVVLAYWLLASSVGANLLAWSLDTGARPLRGPDQAIGARAVVLLGGGSINVRAEGRGLTWLNRGGGLRAIETARVYHLLGDPLVIVSAGVTDKTPGARPESDAYRTAMLELGVPAERIETESESRNTHEQAQVLQRLLGSRGIDRFVLVTSPLHMGRSMATFAAQGLHPIPSPAPLYADRPRKPFWLVPNDGAFEVGNAAVYEWLARAYYWSRGWTRGA